jgi:type IV pilus assembly protein PilB
MSLLSSSREAAEVETRLREVVDLLRDAEDTARALADARARISELESGTVPEAVGKDALHDAPAWVDDPRDVGGLRPHDPPVDTTWMEQARRTGRRSSRLGELLVAHGLVTTEDVERALDSQRATGLRLGETLVEMAVVSAVDLTRVLADHLGFPFADLEATPPELAAAALLSGDVARRYRAVPVQLVGEKLVVAMADPNDVFALDDLRLVVGHSIIPALSESGQLAAVIDRLYHETSIESTMDDAADEGCEQEQILADIAVDEGPIVRLVNALLEQAVADHASDLHIEPSTDQVSIRFRVDGILHDVSDAPLSLLRPLVSRVKVLAGIDISQSRVPQDGRFSLTVRGRTVDIRAVSVPTAAGEAVVLRLLDSERAVTTLDMLHLTASEHSRFARAYDAPQGAIFVTGPTGSGKSSTLYAVVSELNSRSTSIVSVEDPVEYRVGGVKQLQINNRAGMTFPGALRALLRADPDVVLIGEVRDTETARIAADAAITGHLVLSTLHTTRAAAAPARLIDMGVEPYLVASALTCVVAQRLVRKLCSNCATPVEPDRHALKTLGITDSQSEAEITINAAVGCPSCLGTGYRGRDAIFEIMPLTDDLSRLIVDRASVAQIERVATEQGMDTLRQAAIKRVLRGELSIEEMVRVVS